MTQIITILLDSVRMLLARKLFWVSFIITAIIGVAYLSIGFSEDGVTILFGHLTIGESSLVKGSAEGEWFYTYLFTSVITPMWLGSGAIFLALISTVSVFPEFLRGGSIEVSLSKPVSRVKLFVVKYIGCLFFVAFQTSLLALLVFFAIGNELNYWNWSVFWVIPIVTFTFSLIHCVQVLIGVITGSSLSALVAGICFFGCAWGMQITEQLVYMNTYALPEEQIAFNWNTAKLESTAELNKPDETSKDVYSIVEKIAAPMPKVRDVTLYIDQMVKFRDSGSVLEQIDLTAAVRANDVDFKTERAKRRMRERHSATYIFLSSLGFEVVILGLGCWIFSRKDY